MQFYSVRYKRFFTSPALLYICCFFYFYFKGYFSVNALTIAFAFGAAASPSLIIIAMASAIWSISSSTIPREVTAGVPTCNVYGI